MKPGKLGQFPAKNGTKAVTTNLSIASTAAPPHALFPLALAASRPRNKVETSAACRQVAKGSQRGLHTRSILAAVDSFSGFYINHSVKQRERRERRNKSPEERDKGERERKPRTPEIKRAAFSFTVQPESIVVASRGDERKGIALLTPETPAGAPAMFRPLYSGKPFPVRLRASSRQRE